MARVQRVRETWQREYGQAHGRSGGEGRYIAAGGEDLGEGEAQEGIGRLCVITSRKGETDSQGEQGRETGEREPTPSEKVGR